MIKITDELIKHLEDLSKIGLSDEERERLKSDLQEILDYMEMLDEVDVSGVEPMYTPIESDIPKRKDEVRRFDPEGIRKNFPEEKDGYLIVPPILES